VSKLLRSGRPIYIGLALSKAESAAALAKFDDAIAEIVALIGYRDRG
jgi:hypothetical protein